MPRLFLFGIGGTGSRVIRSFTFLMAAGVKTGDWDIVPVLIDPDNSGGDLNRTNDLLNNYYDLHDAVKDIKTGHFFERPVYGMNKIDGNTIAGSDVTQGFRFEIEGVQNERFKEFIDLDQLSESNRAFTELLFSRENLDADLKVGFKGNPNIGSVVLNVMSQSLAFDKFARLVTPEDRVFIISSIFGGTGAAGFPLLLKNIRDGKIGQEHYEQMQNVPVGAISILPYFKVTPDENSKIDSKTFITKTQAALHYYAQNVTGNNSVNCMYYIGDGDNSEYPNEEGGRKQENNAHFVELAAALSIVDFLNTDKAALVVTKGIAASPVYKEFGIKTETGRISLPDLGKDTRDILEKPLLAFFYFSLFVRGRFASELKNPYANAHTDKFDENFVSQLYFKTTEKFCSEFQVWLGELAQNRVAFVPFNITPVVEADGRKIKGITLVSEQLFTLVHNLKERKGLSEKIPGLRPRNYEFIIEQLNKAAITIGNAPVNKRFITVFSKAMAAVVEQKLMQE